MTSPSRLFVMSVTVAAVSLLSACSQPAAPIRGVGSTPEPTGAVALPVAAPNSNFESTASATAQPGQTQAEPQQTRTQGAATSAGAMAASGEVREGERRLALVETCQANNLGVRDQCTLGFADTRGGREVPIQVQSYFLSTSPDLAPKVNFENYCGSGWLATVLSIQGSVQAGGVIRTQAAVCGHPSAGNALTALFDACDAQTQGGCRKSTSIKVAWGYWDGVQMPGTDADIGRPYPADRFPDAQMCDAPLPLQESGLCPASAAVPLKLLGLP
jgi:hypothetical protein